MEIDKTMWKKIKEYIINNSILIEMLFIMIITGLIAQVPFYRIMLFLYVQICVIYLTGRTVLKFTKFVFRNRLSFIFSSYAVGYAVSLSLYLVTLVLNAPNISVPLTYLLSVMNIGMYINDCKKQRKGNMESISINKVELGVAAVFFLIASITMFWCFQARMLSADITGYVSMFADDQFWFREAVEGTRGFPVPDFSASGVIRSYHYFSGTWCSFLHYLTGIEIFDICFTFSWVGDVFLLVGGIYMLFMESEHISIKYTIIALIALLFTTSAQQATKTYYFSHLFVCHFGYLLGSAMGMYSFGLFLKWYENGKRSISSLLLCIIMLLTTLGLKSPCGCLVLAGIGTVCALMLFWGKDRKERLSGFFVGIVFLVSFIAFYKLFFTYPKDASIYNSLSREDRFSLTGSLFQTDHFQSLAIDLSFVFENTVIGYILTYLLYWFLSNFVVAVFMLLALYRCVKYKIRLEFKDISSLAMVVCGYLFYTIMHQSGYSQVYFMFALFPYGMYLSLNILGRSPDVRKEGRLLKSFQPSAIIISLVLILGMYKTLTYYPYFALLGLKNLNTRYDAENDYPGSTGNDVNKKELEALRWLRENSDEDALLITNLAIINDRSFTTSCYTERQIYIEGEAYGAASKALQDYRVNLIKEYYSGSDAAAQTLINEGVDYAVIFGSVPGYTGYVGNIIYENDAVKVVEMIKY